MHFQEGERGSGDILVSAAGETPGGRKATPGTKSAAAPTAASAARPTSVGMAMRVNMRVVRTPKSLSKLSCILAVRGVYRWCWKGWDVKMEKVVVERDMALMRWEFGLLK